MRIRKMMAVFAVTLLATVMTACMSGQQGVQQSSAPKNVIVFIADGWSYTHVDATSMYEHGETGVQPYEQFPIQLGMSTFSASGHGYAGNKASKDFDYVRLHATDSAAAATAMSTGVKVYNGSIGMDMTKQRLRHMSEAAKDLGKSIGTVTSVQFSHGTPAGFITHADNRNDYHDIGPRILFESRVDVIMGAGHPLYDDHGNLRDEPNFRYVGGEEMWDFLNTGGISYKDMTVQDTNGDGEPNPWTFIQTREEFEALVDGDTPDRVIGIVQVWETLQNRRAGDRYAPEPYMDPMIETVPSLETMSLGALNLLRRNPNGFFVMIEGGAVDWASHANESGRVVEEMIDFNQTVATVIEWVEANSSWDETLMIVTGDHETGYLTGPGSGNTEQPDGTIEMVLNPPVNNGKGNMPGIQWNSGSHTNQLIPFYAKGAGADHILRYADEWDPVRGYYINNTDLAKAVFTLYGE